MLAMRAGNTFMNGAANGAARRRLKKVSYESTVKLRTNELTDEYKYSLICFN